MQVFYVTCTWLILWYNMIWLPLRQYSSNADIMYATNPSAPKVPRKTTAAEFRAAKSACKSVVQYFVTKL